MNNPNPLLPQGTIPPRPKSTLYVKILMIVAVHVVVIGGLLIVGCKDTTKTAGTTPKSDVAADTSIKDPMSTTKDDFGAPTSPSTTTTTASLPTASSTALPGSTTTTASLPMTSATPATTIAPVSSTMTPSFPATTATTATAPTATAGSVYVVAQGDRLSTIAKKSGVSLKALEEANTGVDPKKLQIGQKLQIPASTATTSTATTSATPMAAEAGAAPAGDSSTYVVKSGDVLVRIAKAHGTTVKALEALNDMKTSNIKPGQKLKIPVMKMASVDTTPAPSAATSVTPASPSGTVMPAMRAN